MLRRTSSRSILWGLVASTMFSCVAVAAGEASAGPSVPSKEVRAKMANLHEEMAACLRSEKSLSDCHSEMRKGCQQLMGDSGCPMMGMHHHRMKGPAAATPKGQ